jgi:2-methylisocitrate lyase-like PEP mutase family enzyme
MIFEDQLSPKKCAACANRIELIPPVEAVAKIRAAVEARQNKDVLIIARTDELEEADAIARAKLYVEAGADLIQPISRCFSDHDGLKRLREACGVPLSLQILGWLESDLSADQIREVAGLACYPLVGLMSAAKSLQENYAGLARDLSSANLPHPKMSMDEFRQFIGFEEIEKEQERFLLTE